jgi:hypothetical protein
MHIFQMLTQQDRRATEGTLLGTMHSRSAHKAPTHTKEQVSISIKELTKGVEGIAIHSNRDMRGERQIFINDMPVGVVERRHNNTLSELTCRPFIRPVQTKNYCYSNFRTNQKDEWS